MFDPIDKLLLGLLSGFVFGFLLQKGQVAKYGVIMDQFLLRDWTVVKIMFTAVVVGAPGVYLLVQMGVTGLEIKAAKLGGIIFGGILFGTGLAILGLCPGTSVAACGAGHRDAMIGVLGMFTGALVFVALFPNLQPVIKSLGDLGKVTLPQITGTSPWIWIGGLIIAAAIALPLLKSRTAASMVEPA